jgi:hypothetical protein
MRRGILDQAPPTLPFANPPTGRRTTRDGEHRRPAYPPRRLATVLAAALKLSNEQLQLALDAVEQSEVRLLDALAAGQVIAVEWTA